MSDKTVPLSIIISTVDRATGGLKHIAEKLEHLQKPFRSLEKAQGKFLEATGLKEVKEGFAGLGETAKGIGEHFLHLAEAVGLGTAEIIHLIHEFTELGHTAKLIGITVDSLAGLRYAAGQSGVAAEELDGAMEKFNLTLGKLHQRGGPLFQLLSKVSPTLLKSVQGSKSAEEAFGMLADAMEKVKDPTKRAQLAVAAFGKAGQPMINMLAEGREHLEALTKEHEKLAGSQEGGTEAAEKMHGAMLRIGAVLDGVKAALLEGLEPAFLKISGAIQAFLVGHRAEIAEFLKEFGEKLPGRIDDLVGAFKGVGKVIGPVWDALGGLKGMAIALAAIMAGKLILAVYALSTALLTTPVGWVLLGLAALVAAGVALASNWDYVSGFFVECWNVIKEAFGPSIKWIWGLLHDWTPIGFITDNWQPISDFFEALWGTITTIFEDAWADIKRIIDQIVGGVRDVKEAGEGVKALLGFGDAPAVAGSGVVVGADGVARSRKSLDVTPQMAGTAAAAAAPPAGAVIKVDFSNAPKGTRVSTEPHGPAQVDLSVGYQMIM